ncbi:unnamed protein product [Adineta steineri]|uniref:G-protein coupled receptors family 1 profile domain-containing protein n=1 Tax=Adineta steineri TaxID=433720 RepID=A0A814WI09_9BILA|nr:unnamed protein product [Adineta steineri]CAF4140550.1 unnamed protein product [Adineta steineri]
MDIVTIQIITDYISHYTPYIILVLGNIGCICNFLTFTAKQLRQNSCGWYFLMSALSDFTFINFGLFTKISSEQYGSTLQNTNLPWCKIRTYFTWVLPCFATGYLVLASLDRCLSTSTNARLRSFSHIKIAHRMTCIPIILYSLTTSHQFIYFVLQPECTPLPGTYSYFLSMYSIIWTSLIPQSAILIFGFVTYLNIRRSHRRLIQPSKHSVYQQQRNRTDIQMIKITLVQVICSSILLNIRTAYYSYIVLSTNITNDNYRYEVESLLLQISSYIFYFNFCKSFLINTLTSKLFRKILKERLFIIWRRITSWKVRVAPNFAKQMNQTKLGTINKVQQNIEL